MDADVALSDEPTSRTVRVGTELVLVVHGVSVDVNSASGIDDIPRYT
jgi:hypothetical protein